MKNWSKYRQNWSKSRKTQITNVKRYYNIWYNVWKNLEYFKELSLYIIAGEKKIEELRNVTLPELQKRHKNLENNLMRKK